MIKKYKFITLFFIFGVPIRAHWTLSFILFLVCVGSLTNISLFVGAVSFFGIIFIHELGHMWFATRQGLGTERIDLYLFHGACYHELAETEYENNIVAWGGVVAQLIVAIPCIFIERFMGELLPWFLYTPIFYLGYLSLLIAIVNLAPGKRLDGSKCWKTIIPYFKYRKQKKKKNPFKIVK